jgi:hypothetical protein
MKTLELDNENVQPLVVSQQRAAVLLDVCVDTIEDMARRGDLERVRLSRRKYGITMRSVRKKAGIE